MFYRTNINELKIGDHSVNNIHATVKSSAGNNLGLAFFKNYRVILNWQKKRMRMIEITKAGNDSYESYGFSTLYENNGIYVNEIIETSSAAEFLKQGDKIMSINNSNYSNTTEEQYCDFYLEGYDNGTDTVSITVLRDEKELTFKLVKTKLL